MSAMLQEVQAQQQPPEDATDHHDQHERKRHGVTLGNPLARSRTSLGVEGRAAPPGGSALRLPLIWLSDSAGSVVLT